ncbi:ionotropic receptor 85a [Haematobia irritans]|uniref:ionotropic receptor 85a n=1 Tax=Haematobia irritans TaxID=7368 RepID=UPI003F500E64
MRYRISWFLAILGLLNADGQNHTLEAYLKQRIIVNSWIPPNRQSLLEYTSHLFCSSHLKLVHIYWERKCSFTYCSKILRRFSECGLSHVILRNRYPSSSSLEKLKDNGILLHLLIILPDISHTLDLSIIRKKSSAKHLTFIVVVVQQNTNAVPHKWLRSTFEIFWNLWIMNIAIIYADQEKETIVIYRYDPFSEEPSYETLSMDRSKWHLDQLFPRTMINMKLKPLRICLYADEVRSLFLPNGHVHGTDGLMTSYLAERMNATALVNRIGVYGNESASQDLCFRETVDEIDHLAGNIRFLSPESFYGRVENTLALNRDDLCVLVPKARIASSFWNLFRSFNCNVWMYILVTLLGTYGFCVVVFRSYLANDKLMLDLLACMVTTPYENRAHSKMSLRIFFTVWLIYGLLISAAFKGNLTSNLVQRKYLSDINTLGDLAKSEYPLATLPRHVKHLDRYLDAGNPNEALIKNKMVTITDGRLRELVEENNRNYAYLQKHHLTVFRANSRKHSLNGRPCFHAMAQCLVPFHAVYIVPYGSPFLGYINRLMRNAQEHGYINHWDHLMSAAFKRTRRIGSLQRHNDDEPEVLQLIHFQAAFCLWICGLVIAFVQFLVEIFKIQFCLPSKGIVSYIFRGEAHAL